MQRKYNPYFNILGFLNKENKSDCKVLMLNEVNLEKIELIRDQYVREQKIKPSYTAFIADAISKATIKHPHANSISIFNRVIQLDYIDIAVAVERELPNIKQAVYTGIMRNVDKMDLESITKELKLFSQATPENSKRWSQMRFIVEKLPSILAKLTIAIPRYSLKLWREHRGGAIMISSPAKYGVDAMIGSWPYPIGVSFGLAKERAVVIDGKVVPRKTMFVSMSFDRRFMGGAQAAQFFNDICVILENQ